jgi:hypothetical protein
MGALIFTLGSPFTIFLSPFLSTKLLLQLKTKTMLIYKVTFTMAFLPPIFSRLVD